MKSSQTEQGRKSATSAFSNAASKGKRLPTVLASESNKRVRAARLLLNLTAAGWLGASAFGVGFTPVVDTFDNAGEVGNWRYDFGLPPANLSLSWDSTMDANNNANSGAMKASILFDATQGGNNKMAFTIDFFPAADASVYPTLDMDFKIQPGSAESFNPGSGIYGYEQWAIRNTGNYNYQSEGGRNFGLGTPAGTWFHVSIPTSSFSQPIDQMRALTLQLYGGPGHNLNGNVTFWMDNIVFTPEPSAAVILGLGALVVAVRRRNQS
jgi:hypothetical protein